MKILLVSTHFTPYKGGLENFVLELATRLSRKDIDVTVVCLNTENVDEYEKINGVEVYRLLYIELLGGVYSIPRKNKHYDEKIKQLEENKYDIVITNTRFFYFNFVMMKFAKKCGAKYIHIEHGNTFVKHPNKIVEFGAWCYDQTLGRSIMRNADVVVGISQKCCDFATGLGAKNVKLIHNAIDTARFKKVETDLKRKLGLHSDDVVITFVGRLIQAKGVHLLIQAIRGQDWKLLIVGKGVYESELKKIASANVHFLGEKNQEEIVEVLSITDVFVNPSFSEGLPTSVLEAHIVGVPIVATDVGGTNEIINGVLIQPGSAKEITRGILKILQPKSFDWNDKVEEWENLLRC